MPRRSIVNNLGKEPLSLAPKESRPQASDVDRVSCGEKCRSVTGGFSASCSPLETVGKIPEFLSIHSTSMACKVTRVLHTDCTQVVHNPGRDFSPGAATVSSPCAQRIRAEMVATRMAGTIVNNLGVSHRPLQTFQNERRDKPVPGRPDTPPVKSRRMPLTIFAITTKTTTKQAMTANSASAMIPSSTHNGHQRRSKRKTLPCIERQASPARFGGTGWAGGGAGLPSISRTSASMVSGTASILADLPGGAIRSLVEGWNRHRVSG